MVSGKDLNSSSWIQTSGFSELYSEEYLFATELPQYLCQKSAEPKFKGLFLDSQFCSINLLSVFTLATYCFHDIALHHALKSGYLSPPASFFFKIVLAILGPFHIYLGWAYHNYCKKIARTFTIIVLNL